MTNRRAENMKRLNANPEFAAKRDRKARERFTAENERLQRLANIAKRGCEVPAHLEDAWRDLKRKLVPNREAARMLDIPWLAGPDDEVEQNWKVATARRITDELIDHVEKRTLTGHLDPDEAYEIMEYAKRSARVLAWNGQGGKSL